MKNLLCASLMLFATAAFAQQNGPGHGNVSGKQGKPPSVGLDLGGFSKLIGTRVHTLDIQNQFQQMKRDGVTEKKNVAMFSATGALVYHFELRGDELSEWNDIGRNAGIQIVPYSLKVDTQGNYAAAFNAMSYKNLHTLQSADEHCIGGNDIPFVNSLIDNIDFVVFRWEKGLNFDSFKSQSVDLVNIDLKLDILDSKKSTRYLALTAGGRAGWNQSSYKLASGENILIGSESITEKGKQLQEFGNLQGRYGLEYSDEGKKGARITVKAGASNNFTEGYYLDPETVKAVEVRNTTPDENGKLPEQHRPLTYTVRRASLYITPSVEYSVPLNKAGNHPTRLGARVNANMPVKDVLKGGRINEDLSKQNINVVNASLFFNF